MSIATARTIDLHAHVVLEETFGTAGVHGPELTTAPDGRPLFRVGNYRLHGVRYRGSAFMDVDVRLSAMDRAGIDFQVLSPNPLTYFHFVDADSATAFCRRANDVLAALVAKHPGRLAGLAALPMQDPAAACAELKRAVHELGLWGASIGTEFGIRLDAPELDRFYGTCVDLDVPLFFHPAPAGIDGPAAFPEVNRYDLDLLLGFAAQETLAVGTLIYGGVLDRHPALDVCFSHGGGAIAFLAGRFAEAARKRPWSNERLREPGAFEARLRRLWYDNHVHDPRSLALLHEVVGRDRVVLGTNFAGWDQPAEGHEIDAPAWLADNARRLLRRSNPAPSGAPG
ncbi:MAG: amidohydrolase family protein [Steroidobacteraceae bacterium]|jgi:aminocarboxymuconate-semialdehyde decarboxylase|nr:amidohydrolase family protein [Steroidobacteraceae bacterium]